MEAGRVWPSITKKAVRRMISGERLFLMNIGLNLTRHIPHFGDMAIR